jgi:RNase P subunit RPR2
MRRLFALAGDAGDWESASDYAGRAHSIALRCNTRVPPGLKALYCRKCGSYYGFGRVRVRLNARLRRVERRCLNCGRVSFHPYVRP